MSTADLLRIDLIGPESTVALRHLARRAAQLLGLTDIDTTRVTTVISELGRAAEPHAPAEVRFLLSPARTAGGVPAVDFVMEVRFAGAGQLLLRDVELGRTLLRLMDGTSSDADTVRVVKTLHHPIDDATRVRIHDALLAERAPGTDGQSQSVHTELVRSLSELRDREAELVNLNAELDETNRGVVALYAELERNAAQIRSAQRAVFEELEDALRPPVPTVDGLEFGVRYQPAQANSPTGGDLYDWFLLPDGSVQIIVVDVRGHGVEGTRDALLVTHATRTLILEGHPLGEVLGRVDTIVQSGPHPVIATAALARLDPASGVAEFAGAGHPPALRVGAGETDFVEARGRALGYPGAGSRMVARVQLNPGDGVLLYTDGLTEVRRDIIEGMETLREAAADSVRLPLTLLLDDTVTRCVQGAILDDDALLLGVRWSGPTSG